jgi:putative Holliday junction resolvase
MIKQMQEDKGRYIAIDFGLKRIGIAVSDPLEMFATPLATIPNDDKFWIKLKELLKPYKIKAFILGYPLKESGEKTIITEEVEKFAETLKKKFNKEVIFEDERYSSSIAEEQILETVASRKKRRDKSLIDKKAAAVILQSFLDSINN